MFGWLRGGILNACVSCSSQGSFHPAGAVHSSQLSQAHRSHSDPLGATSIRLQRLRVLKAAPVAPAVTVPSWEGLPVRQVPMRALARREMFKLLAAGLNKPTGLNFGWGLTRRTDLREEDARKPLYVVLLELQLWAKVKVRQVPIRALARREILKVSPAVRTQQQLSSRGETARRRSNSQATTSFCKSATSERHSLIFSADLFEENKG